MIAGIAILLEARTFPALHGQRFGASFFPSVVGGVLALTGLALAAVAVIRGDSRPWMTLPDWMRSRTKVLSFLFVLVAALFYIAVSIHLGFIVTTCIIVFCLNLWLGGGKVESLAVALGSSVAFYVVFAVILRVPLHRGVIEHLIF